MNNKINTFIEFWQAVRSIKCNDDEVLLFRGHPDKKYLLLPSVFRDSKKDFEMNQYHEILIEYPEEFQKRSHLSNLVKMQHYGVSTRLLDFTRNPLVALFFASEKYDINDDNDGEVICIKIKKYKILHHNSDKALMLSCLPCFSDNDKKEMRIFCNSHKSRINEQFIQSYDNIMHKFLHEVRGEYPGFECEIIGEDLLNGYFVAPFKDNERMKLQNGLFYIFGLDETKLDNKNMDIFRCVINKNCKNHILEDLKLMNISNAYLYSGVERAAMRIKNKRVKWIDENIL